MKNMDFLTTLGKLWYAEGLPFWELMGDSGQKAFIMILGIATIILWVGAVVLAIIGIVKWVYYARQKNEAEIEKGIKPFKVFGFYLLLSAILLMIPILVKICMEIAKAILGV